MEKIGYACINLSLSKDKISTNRGMIKKTFDTKGLSYVSDIIILNLKDLITIINWNEKNIIRNYRMSSDMFPWFTHYNISELPNINDINKLMIEAGSIITKFQHKVSFHPGPFNCLASPNIDVVNKTIYELEQHSLLMDMMNLDKSPFYNINIHVGGVYGDKKLTIKRFIENFNMLSDSLKKRLTLENDDNINGYTIKDLYEIYEKTGIPIVFDTLHYHCNPGDMSYLDSLNLALSTWNNVIPEIHHSSSRKLWEDKTKLLKNHADFIYEKVDTNNKDIYITFESKMKDLAVIKYRKDFLNYQ